jgi:hypothetical protein
MSSRNDETSGMIFVVAIIGAAAYAFIFLVFMIAAFVTFVLTLLCLHAWFKPRAIRNVILMPEEARSFIKRGLLGALMLPAFAVFLEIIFDLRINADVLPYLAALGYMGGSLGIEILMAEEEASPPVVNAPRQHVLAPSRPVERIVLAPPRQRKQSGERHPSFDYATWDDEEG